MRSNAAGLIYWQQTRKFWEAAPADRLETGHLVRHESGFFRVRMYLEPTEHWQNGTKYYLEENSERIPLRQYTSSIRAEPSSLGGRARAVRDIQSVATEAKCPCQSYEVQL